MIEAGYYTGTISECVFAEGKGGNVEVVLKFDLGDNTFRTVFLYTTDAAWPYTREKLERLGWNGNTESPEFSNGENVELACKHEDYQGETREKWDLAPGMKAAAPADKRKRLEALWRAKGGKTAAVTKPGAPKPAPSAAKTPPAAPPDDAPPFESEDPPADEEETAGEAMFSIKTKDDAWAAWKRAEQTHDVARWKTVIAGITKSTGKREAQFGPEEWDKVAEQAVPL